MLRNVIALIAVAFVLTGCKQLDPREQRLLYGGGLKYDIDDLKDYTAKQEAAFRLFAKQANVDLSTDSLASLSEDDWINVTAQGMNYLDLTCQAYLHDLYRLNGVKSALSSQISLTGAATSATLGLADTSAKAIALVATAFGLASGTVDNVSGIFLYQLDSTAVGGLIDRARASVRADFVKSPSRNRTEATAYLQRYAALCLPERIAGMVNEAIKISTAELVRVGHEETDSGADGNHDAEGQASQNSDEDIERLVNPKVMQIVPEVDQ